MRSRLMIGTSVLAVCVWAVAAQAAGIPGQGTWETVLQPRDLNRDGAPDAYYDTDQKLTWLADARYARTLKLGIGGSGRMEWADAETWVSGLSYAGITGWRQPQHFPLSSGGWCTYPAFGRPYDCGYYVTPTTSEMAYLYYVILGNVAEADLEGWSGPRSNTGPFTNVVADRWWSKTTFVNQEGVFEVWGFGSQPGAPAYQDKGKAYAPNGVHFIWPVHDGDAGLLVAQSPTATAPPPVPEPASWLLMIAGLVGMGALGRRRARKGT